MARSRLKSKGRKICHSFVMLRHDIMAHDNFRTLGPHATKCLIDILAQYNGRNNGDLSAPFAQMKDRGWRNKRTLSRAIDELIQRGWLVRTRIGGNHVCHLYAITWEPIDHCDGKLGAEFSPSNVPLNTWKKNYLTVHDIHRLGALHAPFQAEEAAN